LQDAGYVASYEDRTSRFFLPAPRVPRLSGVVAGDSLLMDSSEDSFHDLLNTSHQQFNILCSADKDGGICFSIFGIFPIGHIVSNSTFCEFAKFQMNDLCTTDSYGRMM